jgi:PhzF family phenazine biosynthesis protein
MRSRGFRQVDVFTAEPYLGNPVAVVLEGDGLDEEQMATFARWTNLSESTFLSPPTAEGAAAGADYRLRIFTPTGELPFAGHPTLGSCHAWLSAGGVPKDPERIVQECEVGLVELRRSEGRLAFAAPPRIREGELDDELLERIARATGIERRAIRAHAWVDNGPGWCAILLRSAEEVLSLRVDFAALGDVKLGVVGPYEEGADAAIEVRGFFSGAPDADGVVRTGFEDPVTGSLNASIAQWLREEDEVPATYVASQGTGVRRAGRVHVHDDGGRIWVGGDCVTSISGVVAL